MFIGFGLGGSHGQAKCASLSDQHLITANAGASHEDDESYVGIAGGHHGRDDAAFAMADETELVMIHFRAAFEIGEAGFDVSSEIGGGGGGEIAGGFADAAIVHTEDGDALASEVIGEHEKRTVAEEGLVAILRTGAGDENDAWEWAFAGW